jgi:methionyl-tRNA synthetase
VKKRVLITSALPYANGPLHFGHIAGAYLPADCYARFERLMGSDVFYVCGSDEYGVAVTLSAEQKGRSPEEHTEINHKLIQEFFTNMGIEFDHYSRTTNSHHASIVQQFFKELDEGGYIEAKEAPQLFDEKKERFMADRYVIGTCPKCGYDAARGDECGKCGASYEATDLLNPRSKLSDAPLSIRNTRHWYLRFDLFKEKLHAFLAQKKWKPNVTNFAKQYIDDLRPRAITRDLKWGVPVNAEQAEGKVFYVWFDAPIGYISATQEWAEKNGNPEAWKTYWQSPDTHFVQFLGKDNIPFHALFFPAMLMGQKENYHLVDDLVANEFLNLEGRQFSKSEGWTIDLKDFFERFTADQIRYVIASNAPENGDSEFTWQDFQMRCNSELVGKYGNLVNRVCSFIKQHADGKVPVRGELVDVDHIFLKELNRVVDEAQFAFAHYELRKATRLVMECAQLGNAYFDQKAPWKARRDGNLEEMNTTLNLCLECLKRLALLSLPLIPETAKRVFHLIGCSVPSKWNHLPEIKEGETLPPPFVLFQKVEDVVITEELEKLKSGLKKEESLVKYEPLKPSIEFDDFSKLDLRVAKVVEAEKVTKSKKLLKLIVDLGFETRTIVSGISQHITAEEVLGRKVIVVANLKPAKLMGIESQGMLLAGSLGGDLDLATIVKDLPLGATVS